jgi:hypothetical protein
MPRLNSSKPKRPLPASGADPDAVQTASEFCASEKLSRRYLDDLWARGLGPAYYLVGRSKRIPPEARQQWRRERMEAAASAAAPVPDSPQAAKQRRR